MSAKRKSTRREFLKGRAAAQELLGATGAVATERLPAPGVEARNTYLLHLTRAAMACDFEVLFNAGEYSHAPEAGLEALDLVDSLEDQLSVYRDHSELSRLNRKAAQEPVVVESRLFRLLDLAATIHALTDGAFDITSGPLVKTWGFYRRAGRLPTDSELAEALGLVGTRWLALDAEAQTVRFLKSGVEINLGAIGKGYALDRCAELLAAAGIENYILHGGMSSMLARGTRTDQPKEREGWLVGVVHPLRPDRRLAEVRVCNRALGTSGAGTQFFHFQGKRFGHILDPRTGRPAEGVLSATVLAPTAAEADALATACYVMGVERTLELCAARPDLAALLVLPGSASGGIEIRTAGLDESQWKRLTQ